MAKSVRIDTVVLSPSELYRRAWTSLLASLAPVSSVETAATVSEIKLPREDGLPVMVLVDAPGAEQRIALQLGRFCQQHYAFFVVNDYELSTILPLLRQGVTGFIARDDSSCNFARAFTAAAKGHVALPSNVASRAMTELANGYQQRLALPVDLTQREVDVLHLLADGMSNHDIAQSLFLSVRTVEAHLRSLYRKLNVSSRTEAALWAVRNGHALPGSG